MVAQQRREGARRGHVVAVDEDDAVRKVVPLAQVVGGGDGDGGLADARLTDDREQPPVEDAGNHAVGLDVAPDEALGVGGQRLLVGGGGRHGRRPRVHAREQPEGHLVVMPVVAEQQELVALHLARPHRRRRDDGLHANVEGLADALADGQGQVEGAREGVRGIVRDARLQPHGDDMRDAGVDKRLGGGLGEARGDEDEAERGERARLQQLLERRDAHEVGRAAAVLHREKGAVAVPRVVHAAALAQGNQRAQPVGRRVLEAHAQVAARLAHRVADERLLLCEVEHVHGHHLPTRRVGAHERRREEHAQHGHLRRRAAVPVEAAGAGPADAADAAPRRASPAQHALREPPPPCAAGAAHAKRGGAAAAEPTGRGGRRIGPELRVLERCGAGLAVLAELLMELDQLAWRQQPARRRRRVEVELAESVVGQHGDQQVLGTPAAAAAERRGRGGAQEACQRVHAAAAAHAAEARAEQPGRAAEGAAEAVLEQVERQQRRQPSEKLADVLDAARAEAIGGDVEALQHARAALPTHTKRVDQSAEARVAQTVGAQRQVQQPTLRSRRPGRRRPRVTTGCDLAVTVGSAAVGMVGVAGVVRGGGGSALEQGE